MHRLFSTAVSELPRYRGQEDYGSSRNPDVTKRSNTDVREKKRDNHGNGLSRDQKIMYLTIVLLRDTLVKISVEIMTKEMRRFHTSFSFRDIYKFLSSIIHLLVFKLQLNGLIRSVSIVFFFFFTHKERVHSLELFAREKCKVSRFH